MNKTDKAERMIWHVNENEELELIINKEVMTVFDISKLFPAFEELNVAQQGVITYGLKQNLKDKVATMLGSPIAAKVKVMEERFDLLLTGKWKSPSEKRQSLKAKARELIDSGNVTEDQMEVLRKLKLIN